MFIQAVLGDERCGKSALLNQFVVHRFPQEYDGTIEETFRKELTIDDKTSLLEITDTGGSPDFASMQDSWVTSGDAFLLVYDVANRNSFRMVRTM